MTVTPSSVSALWSEGPAPPRRLSAPALGSTSRAPKVCSSLTSCSVCIALDIVWDIEGTPWLGGDGEGRRGAHWRRRLVIEDQAEQFRPGIVPHRIHHPLAL